MSDFKAKMHKIRFPLGLCPRPRWWSLQSSPNLPAVLKGPIFNGRERVERGGE